MLSLLPSVSSMTSEVQQINPWTHRNIRFASHGALAVQIWELANSFFDEVEYLCRGRCTIVKWLYIWSRYVPLAAQIVSLGLIHNIYAPPVRIQLCVATFVSRPIVAQQTLICLEIILLIRVYALYNQSRRVKYFLCAVFLTTCTIETWSNSRIIRALMKGNSCIPERTPSSALVIFGASVTCFQGLILCMTIFKYIVGRRYGWARTPLTSLLLREGIAVCLLIFVVIVVNVAYDSTPSFELVAEIWDAAFAWYISLLSVTGCRLILDMRKLAVSHTARSSDEIELTSNLDLTMT